MYLTRFLRMKSICQSAFNCRPGGCLFGGQAVIGLLCEAFQVCGQYLGLKLRAPLVKGCNTFEFPYPNYPTFAGHRREALWFDAKRVFWRGDRSTAACTSRTFTFLSKFRLKFRQFLFQGFYGIFHGKKDPHRCHQM